MTLRVMLIDDHPVVRAGLRAVLNSFDGVEVEGVDRVLVVGGDEDDLWALGEAPDDAGQLHAVEPGHPDVKRPILRSVRPMPS